MVQMQRTDFTGLFGRGDWCARLRELVSDQAQLRQFVAFVRSDAFMEAMRRAATTAAGRRNIVEALRDTRLRGILLSNYDSHTVRWAIGDLFNSPGGRIIMQDLLMPPSLSSMRAVAAIIRTMVTTDLPMAERTRDFNHYKEPEQELHARARDIQWLKDAFRSDARYQAFEREIATAPGRRRIAALLRTQEFRTVLNDIMADEAGRRRVSDMLTSDAGLAALEVAMRTPEGMNAVGFLWNMPNGRAMILENMLGFSGIGALRRIMGFQQAYNEEKERREQVLRGAPRRR